LILIKVPTAGLGDGAPEEFASMAALLEREEWKAFSDSVALL